MIFEKQQELRYLIDLLQSSAEWRLSEDDPRNPLSLEVDSRINALLGEPDEVVGGRVQNNPKRITHAGQHNVNIGGKRKWVDDSLIEKEPCKGSPTGYRWRLKEGVDAEAL